MKTKNLTTISSQENTRERHTPLAAPGPAGGFMARRPFAILNSLFTAVALCNLAAFLTQRADAVTFTVFTDPHPVVSGGTIGFCYAGNKFVGSVQADGFNVLYSTDLNGGNVQVFAPAVSIGGGNPASEHFVASSLGLGGFPSRDIYVAEGAGIRHITNDGTSSDVFVSGLASPVRGILFDAIGTFGNDMLVTTSGGQIYRITSAGVATLLASIGLDTEGLDIAPLGASFGSFDGQLIVASEGPGQLHAITPGGTVTLLPVFIPVAEELTFVPLNLGASGNPVEGFYGANYTPNVIKGAAAEFSGMQGDVIVTSEFSGGTVTRVHWNGTNFVTSAIGNFPNQPEDGIFVTEAIIHPVGTIRLFPQSATNNVGAAHTVCATVISISTNGVTNVVVGTTVTFNVTNGPNATVNATSVTDSNGVACFTYVGTGGAGTDIIDVSFVDANGKRQATFATKVWVLPPCQLNCADITVCEDQNVVTYPPQTNASDCTVVCSPPSGTVFPIGTTVVVCFASDGSNIVDQCTFSVTVNDCEPPQVACRPAPNPGDKKIPVAGKNPKSGQNPDGYYQLLSKDNSDPNPTIYVGDSASGFVAGPFKNGDIVKITQDPTGTPRQQPGPQDVVAHIWLNGDPLLYAVDSSGNVSGAVDCFLPPPPK